MSTGRRPLPRRRGGVVLALLLAGLACALPGLAGCTAADKEQWDAAMRDARGDNMQLRYERAMIGGDKMASDRR